MSSSEGRRIEDYEGIIGRDEVDSILELAERVRGAKVVHVNATAYGGGVAEILKNLVPLARSIGLDARWQVLKAPPEFFGVTKRLHNALQGDGSVKITEDMFALYLRVNDENASTLDLDGDVVVIHDPQPLPLIEHRRGGKWVWRCHIDTSEPNEEVWRMLRGFVARYDAVIYSLERFVPRDLAGIKVFIRYPSIDPLSDKNRPLRPSEVLGALERFGIDPDRPIIGQVARFDPWKDPLGVIEVYERVKERVPEVQLVMVGSFAHDDPEGVEWYGRTVRRAEGLRDVHILTNLDGVGDLEVNALQRAFTVALQLSTREGFGLAVTEALWKEVPVVARRAGGIPLQVIDGVTGYLVDSLEEAVERVVMLLRRPWLARMLGRNGREHVKYNFLITRDLKDYLRMHIDLCSGYLERP
ncbi:glycosyl transferase family 1 [Candidatus Geothermarchaeota archaeon ex4572_27]|nr:MAG: glycosyl transferase family 1 [Candidatus Geothermarchaeota archaeon ex4572_27]